MRSINDGRNPTYMERLDQLFGKDLGYTSASYNHIFMASDTFDMPLSMLCHY